MPSDQARPTGCLGFSEAEASLVMTMNSFHYCAPGDDTERHPAPDLPMSSSDIWQKKADVPLVSSITEKRDCAQNTLIIIFETTRPLHLTIAKCQADFVLSFAGPRFAAITKNAQPHFLTVVARLTTNHPYFIALIAQGPMFLKNARSREHGAAGT